MSKLTIYIAPTCFTIYLKNRNSILINVNYLIINDKREQKVRSYLLEFPNLLSEDKE